MVFIIHSGEHLLPKEALRPRSPPRTTKVDPYYSSFDQTDLDYDTYYGGNTYSNSDHYGGCTVSTFFYRG